MPVINFNLHSDCSYFKQSQSGYYVINATALLFKVAIITVWAWTKNVIIWNHTHLCRQMTWIWMYSLCCCIPDEMNLPADIPSYLSSQGTLSEPQEGYSNSENGSHQQLMPSHANGYVHKVTDGNVTLCSSCEKGCKCGNLNSFYIIMMVV